VALALSQEPRLVAGLYFSGYRLGASRKASEPNELTARIIFILSISPLPQPEISFFMLSAGFIGQARVPVFHEVRTPLMSLYLLIEFLSYAVITVHSTAL